jgi:hypothetical protein
MARYWATLLGYLALTLALSVGSFFALWAAGVPGPVCGGSLGGGFVLGVLLSLKEARRALPGSDRPESPA